MTRQEFIDTLASDSPEGDHLRNLLDTMGERMALYGWEDPQVQFIVQSIVDPHQETLQ